MKRAPDERTCDSRKRWWGRRLGFEAGLEDASNIEALPCASVKPLHGLPFKQAKPKHPDESRCRDSKGLEFCEEVDELAEVGDHLESNIRKVRPAVIGVLCPIAPYLDPCRVLDDSPPHAVVPAVENLDPTATTLRDIEVKLPDRVSFPFHADARIVARLLDEGLERVHGELGVVKTLELCGRTTLRTGSASYQASASGPRRLPGQKQFPVGVHLRDAAYDRSCQTTSRSQPPVALRAKSIR